MYCRHCGNQLPDGAKFCNRCGNAITDATTSTIHEEPTPVVAQSEPPEYPQKHEDTVRRSTTQSKSKQSKTIGIVFVVIVLVLVVAAVAGMLYLRSEYPKLDDLRDLGVSTMTATLPVGSSIKEERDPIIPIEITFEDCVTKPSANGIQVTATITVRNLRSKVWDFNKATFIAYAGDTAVSDEWEAIGVRLSRYESDTISLTYEVPRGTSTTTLEYRDKILFGTEVIVRMVASIDSASSDGGTTPSSPSSNQPSTNQPAASNSIPTTTQDIEYGDFVGRFTGDDEEFDELLIEWWDFTLYISCSGYRAGYFSTEVLADTELIGNSFSFETPSSYGKATVTLTYIPAADSPYGADTIYMQSDKLFDMAYTRDPNSSYFDPYMPSDPT